MSDVTAARDPGSLLVIGGGIAGLAAALRLRTLAHTASITLAEATSRLGGKIDGTVIEKCVVDGGADVCIGSKLRATHLFADLGLESRVVQVNPHGLPTFERSGTEFRPLPTRFAGELLTFRSGIREIADRAGAALDRVTVIANAPVTKLCPDGTHWNATTAGGDSYSAQAVIIAVPASPAAALLSPIAPAAAARLGLLEYPATTTVSMAWRLSQMPRELDGTGYLVLDESSPVSACTWVSSKNPGHAPSGVVLLRGYIRGSRTGPADAVMHFRDEVARYLGVTDDPLFTRVYEWPAGIPACTPEHLAAVGELEERLTEFSGLFIAGSAFHGVGIPDCIASGERAAAAVVTYLAGKQSWEAA